MFHRDTQSPSPHKKEERRTKDALRTPAKGQIERAIGRRPLRGMGTRHCFYLSNLAVFSEAEYLTLTHQFLMGCQSLLVVLQTLLPPGQDNPSQWSRHYVTTQQAHGNKKLRENRLRLWRSKFGIPAASSRNSNYAGTDRTTSDPSVNAPEMPDVPPNLIGVLASRLRSYTKHSVLPCAGAACDPEPPSLLATMDRWAGSPDAASDLRAGSGSEAACRWWSSACEPARVPDRQRSSPVIVEGSC